MKKERTMALILCLLLLSSCSHVQSELEISDSSTIESFAFSQEETKSNAIPLAEIQIDNSPIVEPSIQLSLYEIAQKKDENKFLSFCWLDNERIAIGISTDETLRVYEVGLSKREIIRIVDTELESLCSLFMSNNGLMAEYSSETETAFYWLDSDYKVMRSLQYDDTPMDEKYYQIAYNRDYSLRAFGGDGVIYIQKPSSTYLEIVYEKDITVDIDKEIYPEYLTPADFSEDGNTLICSNNGTGMGGATSGGGLIDLTDNEITLFDTHGFNYVRGLSPHDSDSILAFCSGKPATRGEAEFINIKTLESVPFSFTQSFCDENNINIAFMLHSFPNNSDVYCCILHEMDIPLIEKTGKRLYHMFLYNFLDGSTRVVYKNYASEKAWMEQAIFGVSERQDKVIGVWLNEITNIYQIALFEIFD